MSGGQDNNTLYYGGTDRDSSRFNEPMLWVGIYVAAANVVCVALILVDIYRNYLLDRPQTKPKLFVLNATVLTLLAIATKIPSDINSPMPGYFDQLCKQSGIYFTYSAMAHVLPSIGVQDSGSLPSNMAALGILVVSTFVNICFQINTGIITRFTGINIVSVVFMLLMYVFLVSHSLSVGGIKELLEELYAPKHRTMVNEVGNTIRVIDRESLRKYIQKYWLMALTSSPNFVVLFMGASTLTYLLTIILFFNFILLALWIPRKLHGERTHLKSDYHWTVVVIFTTQFLAVCASIWRDSIANMGIFRYLYVRANLTELFNPKHVGGNYGWKKLKEWRSDPLPFVTGRKATKFAHRLKLCVLEILIFIQKLIKILTTICMGLNYILIPIAMIWTQFVDWDGNQLSKSKDMGQPVALQQESDQGRGDGDDGDLNDFVLNLKTWFSIEVRKKGKEDWFVGWTPWLRRPCQLLNVIKNGCDRGRDREVHSWSLELATYACIVRASSDQRLVGAIEECFSYAVLIDENIVGATQQQLRAARRVREQLLLEDKWLDLHLPGLLQEVHDDSRDSGDDCNEQLFRRLMDHGSIYKAKLEEGGEEDPLGRVAAECMDEIIKYLMQQGTPLSLEKEVADAMRECLKCLSLAIFRECSRGGYGTRRDHVVKAVQVFQETQQILEIFE